MSISRLIQMGTAGVSAGGGDPEVVGIENTVSSSGTTPSITLPSGISSGDIIVIFVGVDGTPTASISGFTQDIAAVGGWAASATYYVFSKTADGTEGASVTLTLSASETVCASAWVITNADSIAFSATATSAGSVNPDSPSLTSGFGSVPTLWLSSFAADNGTPTITAYPSGYENGQSLSEGANFGSPRLGVASKLQTSASDDPPEYTISESHNWVAVTAAVGTQAPPSWTDPDIANAGYDSKNFYVGSTSSVPLGLNASYDGTKFYIADNGGDSIDQYNLSTAWDISTAAYASKTLSVSSQDTAPQSVAFKLDGTKMFLVGGANDSVYSYSLSTAWDISTASYDSSTFSFSTQTTDVSSFFVTSDGTKIFVISYSTSSSVAVVYQYSLSTGWDLSTTSYDSKSFSVYSEETTPRGIALNPDGTKLYILGNLNDSVYQYSLSTAHDISTASYDSVSFDVNTATGRDNQYGILFKPDGTKMYSVSIGDDRIYQYSTD